MDFFGKLKHNSYGRDSKKYRERLQRHPRKIQPLYLNHSLDWVSPSKDSGALNSNKDSYNSSILFQCIIRLTKLNITSSTKTSHNNKTYIHIKNAIDILI